MGHNPSYFHEGKGGGLDHPVERVTWEDAFEFCRRLGELPAEKAAGRVYRLPTEAEWEFACRAGQTGAFAFGPTLSSRDANFNGNYPYGGAERGPYLERTTRVASYLPNAFGLFDMHGNVGMAPTITIISLCAGPRRSAGPADGSNAFAAALATTSAALPQRYRVGVAPAAGPRYRHAWS